MTDRIDRLFTTAKGIHAGTRCNVSEQPGYRCYLQAGHYGPHRMEDQTGTSKVAQDHTRTQATQPYRTTQAAQDAARITSHQAMHHVTQPAQDAERLYLDRPTPQISRAAQDAARLNVTDETASRNSYGTPGGCERHNRRDCQTCARMDRAQADADSLRQPTAEQLAQALAREATADRIAALSVLYPALTLEQLETLDSHARHLEQLEELTATRRVTRAALEEINALDFDTAARILNPTNRRSL